MYKMNNLTIKINEETTYQNDYVFTTTKTIEGKNEEGQTELLLKATEFVNDLSGDFTTTYETIQDHQNMINNLEEEFDELFQDVTDYEFFNC